MTSKKTDVKLDDIVSLAKRRGFIYQGSEIYGGLAGTWDYGPLGVALKRNIMNLWWKTFVEDRADMYGVDAAILMNPKVWQASGHVDTFTDPMVECSNCHSRLRADKLEDPNKCPVCGKEKTFSEARQFNLMFKTFVGPSYEGGKVEKVGEPVDAMGNVVKNSDADKYELMSYDPTSVAYLRPETAQGIFTNYKNVVDSLYPDLPFGIAQQGKAFRNEISPRDFVFRSREFEQMEIEYFIEEKNWEAEFEKWVTDIENFLAALGLAKGSYEKTEVSKKDLAHYSKRTIDFEYNFPHGQDELLGLAYRTTFDLDNIQKASGKSMEYRPKDGSKPFVPHVIEPSFGVERAVMAVLTSAYTQDEVGDEKRSVLKLPARLAPVKVAVSPLLKNKPELVEKARGVYDELKKTYGAVMWDDNGNIGKRYRRQDEIGTPYCVTIDFDTLQDDTVTVRDRDTTKQQRVSINELSKHLKI